MLPRSTLSLVGLALLGVLAACSIQSGEDAASSGSRVSRDAFDKDDVLDDRTMGDSEAMTAGDVQAFLEKTPWGNASVLASYEEGGRSAAQIMVDAAQKHGINPLELLVRVQMEQGLVRKESASERTISLAFGCGCPHAPVCKTSPERYTGFANQAECAAGTMRRSMDRALTSKGTASGWARNRAKTTEDGVTIVPANATTAALYTYTPWVGEAGGGRKGVGGVSLHHRVWSSFAAAIAEPEETTTADAGAPDARHEEDAGEVEPPTPTPTPDSGAADAGSPPAPDAGAPADAGSSEQADAGSGSSEGESTEGPPEDGSDDDDILGEGSAPPADNDAPPPRSRRPSSEDDESEGERAADLGATPTANQGCSTTGGGAASNGALVGLALAAALVASRRRR